MNTGQIVYLLGILVALLMIIRYCGKSLLKYNVIEYILIIFVIAFSWVAVIALFVGKVLSCNNIEDDDYKLK